MVEYLILNKPVLYTQNRIDISKTFNEFGKLAYECHYLANNEEDIESFINKTILANEDEMKCNRERFVKKYINNNNITSSKIIINDIISNIIE